MVEDMINLIKLHRGDAEAMSYHNFKLSHDQIDFVKDSAKFSRTKFEIKAGRCAIMSAVLAMLLAAKKDFPVFLVAGKLIFQQLIIFGGDQEMEYLASNNFILDNIGVADWDGHFWVIAGNHIIDISFLSTATSDISKPWLKQMVDNVFGINASNSFLFGTTEFFQNYNLKYVPKRIFNDDDINRLVDSYKHYAMNEV